jgi:hypothetical protein
VRLCKHISDIESASRPTARILMSSKLKIRRRDITGVRIFVVGEPFHRLGTLHIEEKNNGQDG